MSFYVLVWYSYLELRQTTPKELAAALNRGTLVELAFTVPLAVLFIYGGYLWEVRRLLQMSFSFFLFLSPCLILTLALHC